MNSSQQDKDMTMVWLGGGILLVLLLAFSYSTCLCSQQTVEQPEQMKQFKSLTETLFTAAFTPTPVPFSPLQSELIIPSVGGVVLQGGTGSNSNYIRVAGTATSTNNNVGNGSSTNQIQIYNAGNLTAAFDTDGLYVRALNVAGGATLGGNVIITNGGTLTVTGGTLTSILLSGGTILANTTLTNNGTISGGTISGCTISGGTINTGTGTISSGTITGCTISGGTINTGTGTIQTTGSVSAGSISLNGNDLSTILNGYISKSSALFPITIDNRNITLGLTGSSGLTGDEDPLNSNRFNSTFGTLSINKTTRYMTQTRLYKYRTFNTSIDGLGVTTSNIITSKINVGSNFYMYEDGSGFSIVSGGNVGVTLAVGSTSWAVASDIRIKKNISDIPTSLQNILSLRPVTFHYKTDSDTRSLRHGFIAQHVQQYFPHAVYESESNSETNSDDSSKKIYYDENQKPYNPLTLSTTDLIPNIIKSIQELYEEQRQVIQEQQKQIKALSDRLSQLENKNAL